MPQPLALHQGPPIFEDRQKYLSIDDPVQSMDPARADGLARVLECAARSRQLVVFTHDDRLASAEGPHR